MKKTDRTMPSSREVYEYAFSSVPADKRKPLNSILLVLVGFCLSTSSIATGIRVGYSVSFGSALWICIAGNLVLFLCALFWGMLGCRTGYTSQHLLGAMLGRKVSLLFSGFVILAMTIWLGMNGEWLANIVFHLFSQWRIPVPVTTLLIIAVGTCCSTFGWKTLEITSKIMVPIILVVGYVILHVNSMGIGLDAIAQYQPRGHLSASESFVLVVGNFAMSAITIPDLCRFAKSRKAVLGCVSTYFLTLTACNLCGILIAQTIRSHSLTYSVYLMGATLPGLVCLSMCTYTTQNVNMYIGSLAYQNVLKDTSMGGNLSHKMAVLFMGGFAMVVGAMGIGSYLVAFNRFLALGAVSLTGIALIEYLMGKKRKKVNENLPLLVWLFSVAVGLAVWLWKGTGVGVLSVTVVSASTVYAITRGKDPMTVP